MIKQLYDTIKDYLIRDKIEYQFEEEPILGIEAMSLEDIGRLEMEVNENES